MGIGGGVLSLVISAPSTPSKVIEIPMQIGHEVVDFLFGVFGVVAVVLLLHLPPCAGSDLPLTCGNSKTGKYFRMRPFRLAKEYLASPRAVDC